MPSPNSEMRRLYIWVPAVIVVLILIWLSARPLRRLTGGFFGSLRVRNVQAVNVNLSNFVGPDANRSLQQMVSQMISDTVKVTADEDTQPASDAAAASKLAGFPVQLLSARKDAPVLAVKGEHAFQMTVDRTRLETILREAGRPDLSVPSSVNGAVLAVKIPRTLLARYGNCPQGGSNATANLVTPTPTSTAYSDCVILMEGPNPEVDAPQGLDLGQLTEIGLEVAGMTPKQSQQFLQTVPWKAMLSVPVPRFIRSYATVDVNGTSGTLLNMAARQGPTYTLVWAHNGMAYSLVGYGDSTGAVSLADSLQ